MPRTATDEIIPYLDEVFTHDAEVRPCFVDQPIKAINDKPFDYHLYTSFILKDGDMGRLDGRHSLLKPAAEALTRHLDRFQIVEVDTPVVLTRPGVEQAIHICAGVPLRISAAYHIPTSGVQYAIGMLVRHVGNHYLDIINGPWHRSLMPFKDCPGYLVEKFDYLSIPSNRLDYYGDGGTTHLPGLDTTQLDPESLHHYKIKGNYCYYQGESLVW